MLDLLKGLGEKAPPTCELAPGVFRDVDVRKLGQYVLARWRDNRNGTHSLVPVTTQRVVLNAALIKRLGLDPGCRKTFLRLGLAGNLKVSKVGPKLHMVTLDSLLAHFEQTDISTDEGRGFWTGKNAKRYHDAIATEEG